MLKIVKYVFVFKLNLFKLTFLETTRCTTHLLNRFVDGDTCMMSCTEEMFVLVPVQGLIRFPVCCPVLAMCEGAAAAAFGGT